MLKLCRVVSVPFVFATLLKEQLAAAVKAGIDVTLVSSPGPELDELARSIGARSRPVAIARKPAPAQDVKALIALASLFRRERFDIVHSSTPKAGLLTALAGAFARVPVRMHTYTGQPWSVLRGPKRWAAKTADVAIAKLSTRCYADSFSQKDFLAREGVIDGDLRVIGEGSISGVDLMRFAPADHQRRLRSRQNLGIAAEASVVVFVGRVTKDKGVRELAAAFSRLRPRYGSLHLVLVGPLEPELDPLPEETIQQLRTDPRIHLVGYSSVPEDYLAAADIFCLPSYREGFGSVVIEAGAMGLPTVAARVTGLVDAVVDDETGILVPPRDVDALARAIARLLDSPEIRARFGRLARERARTRFDAALVNRRVIEEYFSLARPGR